MLKKISCEVLSSVPLAKRGGQRRKAHRPDGKDRRTGGFGFTAKNAQVEDTANSVRDPKAHNLASGTLTYTYQSGAAKVSIDNSPTGRRLDSYA